MTEEINDWPTTAFIHPSYINVCKASNASQFKTDFLDFAVRFTQIMFACNKISVGVAYDLANGKRDIEWREENDMWVVTFPKVKL